MGFFDSIHTIVKTIKGIKSGVGKVSKGAKRSNERAAKRTNDSGWEQRAVEKQRQRNMVGRKRKKNPMSSFSGAQWRRK